jgi:hypothetical protein
MTESKNINRDHVGSSFDDHLKEMGIFEEVDAAARQRVEDIRRARLGRETVRGKVSAGRALDPELALKSTFKHYYVRSYYTRLVNRHIGQRKTKQSPRNWFIKIG